MDLQASRCGRRWERARTGMHHRSWGRKNPEMLWESLMWVMWSVLQATRVSMAVVLLRGTHGSSRVWCRCDHHARHHWRRSPSPGGATGWGGCVSRVCVRGEPSALSRCMVLKAREERLEGADCGMDTAWGYRHWHVDIANKTGAKRWAQERLGTEEIGVWLSVYWTS